MAKQSAFGARLAELREAAGLSQYALSKASGVSAQVISNVEKGANPTWETVVKLARGLGVSVADFDVSASDAPAEKPKPKTTRKRKPRS